MLPSAYRASYPGWILGCPEDCLPSLCSCCMSQSQAWLPGVMGRLASRQVCWQTACDSITQLASYLCNKSWEMGSWSLIFYRERRFTGDNAESRWSCLELKGLRGGSPLVNHEPCLLRAFHLFSALQNAGLFSDLAGFFFFFQIFKQILAASPGQCDRLAETGFLWPGLLVQPVCCTALLCRSCWLHTWMLIFSLWSPLYQALAPGNCLLI